MAVQGTASSSPHSKQQLEELHRKAEIFIVSGSYPPNTSRIDVFYRDKDEQYFRDVHAAGNTMPPRLKDFNGDPKNPINGRRRGIFFSTNVHYVTGEPMPESNYGDRRIKIATAKIFNAEHNLYFADFYCMQVMNPKPDNERAHYVTLVIAKEGTEEDQFCQMNLYPLDPYSNGFLYGDRGCRLRTCGQLWVEIFYLHDIKVEEEIRKLEKVDLRYDKPKPSGGNVGLRKVPNCQICNI